VNVLITGTSSGLGLHLANSYISKQHHVIGLTRSPHQLTSSLYTNLVHDLSVLTESTPHSFLHLLKQCQPNVIILNAGVSTSAPFSLDAMHYVVNTNLLANYILISQIAPLVEASILHSVVFIGSLATSLAFPDNPLYQMTKSALCGLSRSIAYDYGELGLVSNVISPGYIPTAMTSQTYQDSDLFDIRATRSLTNSWTSLGSISALCHTLTDPSIRSITGQNIFVDCGISSKGI